MFSYHKREHTPMARGRCEPAFVSLGPNACQLGWGSAPGRVGTSAVSDGPDAAMTNK